VQQVPVRLNSELTLKEQELSGQFLKTGGSNPLSLFSLSEPLCRGFPPFSETYVGTAGQENELTFLILAVIIY
jgi:hypothetical protein